MSKASLRDTIADAIADWAAANGGGFPTAFVFAVDFADEDGGNSLFICEMEKQSIQRSMGLATYLDAWYRDDAVNLWRELWGGD